MTTPIFCVTGEIWDALNKGILFGIFKTGCLFVMENRIKLAKPDLKNELQYNQMT
jgi:hypothetical protein